MLKFIIRRVLQAVLALFVLSILLFAWLRSLPGGVVSALLGERGTPETAAQLRAQLGLDDPIYVQYWRFLSRAVQGDFGISNGVYRGEPALDVFTQRFPATLELSLFAISLALILAIPLGYVAARRRGGPLDTGSVIFSLVGVAVPVFFLAYVLKYIFAVKLGWLPPSGRQTVGINATHITNMYVLDGLITREWDAAWDAFKHLILPTIALASIPFAIIFRITRAAVIDVMDEDYVRTARAKGLSNGQVMSRHVLRNSLIPVATFLGADLGALMGGAIVTEGIFAINGVGGTIYQAIIKGEPTTVVSFTTVLVIVYIVANLIVDLIYAVLDPRIRYA